MFPLLSAPMMHAAWVQANNGTRSARAPQTLRAAERDVRAKLTALVRMAGTQQHAAQQGDGSRPSNSTGITFPRMPVMHLDVRGQPIPVAVVVRADSSMMMDGAGIMHQDSQEAEAEQFDDAQQEMEFDEAQQLEEEEQIDEAEEPEAEEEASAECTSDQSAAQSAEDEEDGSVDADADGGDDGDGDEVSDSVLLEMDPAEMSEEQQLRLLELRYEMEQEAQALAASSPQPAPAATAAAPSVAATPATPAAAASSRARVPFSLAHASMPAASPSVAEAAAEDQQDERDFMASEIGRALHRAMAQQSPQQPLPAHYRQQLNESATAESAQQSSGFVTPPMHTSRAASLLSAGASAVSASVAAASARARSAASLAGPWPSSAASLAAGATGARRTLDLDSSAESMDLSSPPPRTPPHRTAASAASAASAAAAASAAIPASAAAAAVPRTLSFRTPTSPQRRTQAPASASSISAEMASELGLSPEEMEELMAQQMHAMQQIQMLRSS